MDSIFIPDINTNPRIEQKPQIINKRNLMKYKKYLNPCLLGEFNFALWYTSQQDNRQVPLVKIKERKIIFK